MQGATKGVALLVDDLMSPWDAATDIFNGKIFDAPSVPDVEGVVGGDDEVDDEEGDDNDNGDPPEIRNASPGGASSQPIINVNLGDFFKRSKPPKSDAGSGAPADPAPGTPAGKSK